MLFRFRLPLRLTRHGLLVPALMVATLPVMAQGPRTIAIQGVLANSAGIPLPAGTATVTLRLFDALKDGANVWSESNKTVIVGQKGVFTTSLGSAAPLSGVSFDRPYFLEVQVGSDAPMVPRLPLQSVPHALQAGLAADLALPFSGSLSGTGSIGVTLQNTGSGGIGVRSITDSGRAFWGTTNGSYGIFAEALTTGTGVLGKGASGTGVAGVSTSSYGVLGESTTGVAIYGDSKSNGFGTGGHGVFGIARVPGKAGVYGQNDAPGAYGIYGTAQGAASIGVVGTASGDSSSKGVYGSTLGGYGVWGTGDGTGAIGIHGQNSLRAYGELGTSLNGASAGVLGYTPSAAFEGAYGIWGIAENRQANGAGRFDGTVFVYGTVRANDLIVSGDKSFRIDHPLDPANKYLVHYCAEGPEALNLYSGNVTTDANGEALIELPSYFEAENRDFRYQLTVLEDADSASFVQAKVARKIKANRFTIRTSAPATQVSWEVTGVRNDAYSRTHPANVEPAKDARDRGRYLSPESFGQPARMGIGFVPGLPGSTHGR